MRRLGVIALAAVLAGGILGITDASVAQTQSKFITIGTAGVNGVYYSAGGAICRLVNKDRKAHGIRCAVESTGGSVYNLKTIRAGELDMGIVQSDWQYHAYNGTSEFEGDGAYKDLRAVFSLYAEPFTVVARADSGIKTFADLKGKRVNIGNPGSGQRGTMEVVMKALGWSNDDFALAAELKSTEQAQALCDNKIDAIVFTVGHPNGSIKEATTSCDADIIEVGGPEIDKLVSSNAYYQHVIIPGGMYRGNSSDVKTFGVNATVVTSARMSADDVYIVVKAVFDNFDDFRQLHAALVHLNKQQMVRIGLSAPLHDGARKYYREVGLIE